MTGGDRRRQWSKEERAADFAEIAEPGAVVAEVARRSDVCTSLVYKWRREALRRDAASGFEPVVIGPAPAVLASATDEGGRRRSDRCGSARCARADRRGDFIRVDRGDVESAAGFDPDRRATCGYGSRRATPRCVAGCRG